MFHISGFFKKSIHHLVCMIQCIKLNRKISALIAEVEVFKTQIQIYKNNK